MVHNTEMVTINCNVCLGILTSVIT